MSDLISRQAAIEAMLKLQAEDDEAYGCRIPEGFDGDRAKEALEQLPSAQPETQWIPCSERLPENPEDNDYYLVTIQCEHVDEWDDYVTGFAEWTKNGWDMLTCYIGQIKVIAWMPLPEPFKGG